MNCVNLVGRMIRDPEIRYTDGGLSITRFGLAVDRKFKKEGEQSADFPNCVSFGKTAEFVEKYFSKGQRIGLTGRIQTGSYTNKEGAKVYTTDVVVESAEFVESKSAGGGQDYGNSRPTPGDADGFVNIPDTDADELPFN
jgi:single-strand DNA-binding protein